MTSNLSKLSRLQILDCIVVTVGVAAAVWGLLLEMPTPSSAAHHGGCNRWSLAAADQIDTFIPGRAVNWGQPVITINILDLLDIFIYRFMNWTVVNTLSKLIVHIHSLQQTCIAPSHLCLSSGGVGALFSTECRIWFISHALSPIWKSINISVVMEKSECNCHITVLIKMNVILLPV